MSCIVYKNDGPGIESKEISGTTCSGSVGFFTLNFGDTICMDTSKPMIICDYLKIEGPCPTPTQTPTNTITPTVTPTQTPNSLCPQQLTLSGTSSSFLQIIDDGTYTRITSSGSTSFLGGYLIAPNDGSTQTGEIIAGIAPDGNNYAFYLQNPPSPLDVNYNLIARAFNSTSVDKGWAVFECFNNPFTGGSITSCGNVRGVFGFLTDGVVRFPPTGLQSFNIGQFNATGTTYISYSVPCPTPTQTATPTSTPTQTPSNTPTISVTPSNTSTPSITATQTSTPTQTPSNTATASVTNTPTPSVTNTPTPSVTNTQTPSPTNTQTPTNTNTSTPTPSVTPPTYLCYYFQNEDSSSSTIFYYSVYAGSTSEVLGAGNSVQRCVDPNQFAPYYTGGVTTIGACSSVTTCTDDGTCEGCT